MTAETLKQAKADLVQFSMRMAEAEKALNKGFITLEEYSTLHAEWLMARTIVEDEVKRQESQ